MSFNLDLPENYTIRVSIEAKVVILEYNKGSIALVDFGRQEHKPFIIDEDFYNRNKNVVDNLLQQIIDIGFENLFLQSRGINTNSLEYY